MGPKWRKNTAGAHSPQKKGCGHNVPMTGDGTAGSFYEWRARPISRSTEKIEVSHAICDDLMET